MMEKILQIVEKILEKYGLLILVLLVMLVGLLYLSYSERQEGNEIRREFLRCNHANDSLRDVILQMHEKINEMTKNDSLLFHKIKLYNTIIKELGK